MKMTRNIKRAVSILVLNFIFTSLGHTQYINNSKITSNSNDFILYKVKRDDKLSSSVVGHRTPVRYIKSINNIDSKNTYERETIYISKDANIDLTSITQDKGEILEENINVESVVKEQENSYSNPQEKTTREEVKENVAEDNKDKSKAKEAKTRAKPDEEVSVDNKEKPLPDTSTSEHDTSAQENIENDIVNLQSEMELKDLIQTMSEISGEAFILDDSVKGKKVTIIAPQGGFKKKNAYRLFETILDMHGFSIVNKDGVNKIVKKKDIKRESIPTEVESRSSVSSDRFITKIINLKNVKANDISNALRPLISKNGDVLVYPSSNTLIIIDRIDNINRILDIISSLDIEKKIEFIKIHNADAADVAIKLLQIFGSDSQVKSTPTSRSRKSRRAKKTTQNRATQQVSVTGQSDILGFKVITDERTNSLIVIAYPYDMTKIKKMINILDVKTKEAEQGIYVIRIKNADSEQIVSVLSSIIGGSGGTRATPARVQKTRRTGTTGSLSSASSSPGSFSKSRTGTSNQRSSGSLSAILVETEGLKITADPATNSVIILGSRQDYEAIKTVIEELDIRRKQVFVEAAILEVALNDLSAFGFNLSFGGTINNDNLIFGGQQLPGVASLLGAAAGTGDTLSVLGTLSGLFLGIIGEEIDVDGSGPIPPIPSFTALFQALSSITDVNVLSTPSILTTDNEQAEIVVADVIPFPTGSTVGTSGVTVQTIERLPVGIRLAITPQISEGKFLNLNIVTEVSNITEAPQGLNTQDFGIATQTRTADSSIIVKDGQTIVIGGLVSDRESILENKTPVLGDIPLVGNLFKQKQKLSQKLNLIILLTPRIVETDEDMQQILEEEQRRRMLLQERGLNVLE